MFDLKYANETSSMSLYLCVYNSNCKEYYITVLFMAYFYDENVKLRQSLYILGQGVEVPRFRDYRHLKVASLSAPRTCYSFLLEAE